MEAAQDKELDDCEEIFLYRGLPMLAWLPAYRNSAHMAPVPQSAISKWWNTALLRIP
jgi:hypothetical protein